MALPKTHGMYKGRGEGIYLLQHPHVVNEQALRRASVQLADPIDDGAQAHVRPVA